MNLTTKVAYNTFVQIFSKFTATALGLLVVGILTRYLGQAGFGKYTTIMAFLSLFGVIADLGLTLVTAQMISQPGVDQGRVLNTQTSLRFFNEFFTLGLVSLVVLFFPYDFDVKIGVLIGSLSFLFISLNQILVGLFQNKLRMDKVSISEILGRIVLFLGIVAVSYYNWGLLGAIVATVLSNFVNFLFHFTFAKKFIKIKFSFDWNYWGEILKKSWPLAATIVLNLIYLKGDIIILSLVNSQEDVGIYGAGYKVIDVVVMIPFIFAGIVLPILTLAWKEKGKERFKQISQRSFNFMAIISIPLVVGSQFLATEIMTIVAGPEYKMSGLILKILVLATFFIFIGVIFSHIIIAIDKQKKVIGAYIFTSITSLIGYFIFIPKYSYVGAAWMTVYSEAVIALLVFFYVWKYARFVPNFVIFIKSLLASLVMAILLYFIPSSFYSSLLGLCITLFISVLIYFISLYFFGGIEKKELGYILNK